MQKKFSKRTLTQFLTSALNNQKGVKKISRNVCMTASAATDSTCKRRDAKSIQNSKCFSAFKRKQDKKYR